MAGRGCAAGRPHTAHQGACIFANFRLLPHVHSRRDSPLDTISKNAGRMMSLGGLCQGHHISYGKHMNSHKGSCDPQFDTQRRKAEYWHSLQKRVWLHVPSVLGQVLHLFEVATSTTPLSQRRPKRRLRMAASATSVTNSSSRHSTRIRCACASATCIPCSLQCHCLPPTLSHIPSPAVDISALNLLMPDA